MIDAADILICFRFLSLFCSDDFADYIAAMPAFAA